MMPVQASWPILFTVYLQNEEYFPGREMEQIMDDFKQN